MSTIRAPRGRSRLLTVAVVVAALVLVTQRLVAEAPAWVGWAPQTLAYTNDLTVLLGSVIVSALMAWLATPLRTSAGRDVTALSTRSQGQIVRYLVIRAVLVSAVVIAVPTLGALAVTLLHGGGMMTDPFLGVLWFLGSWAGLAALALLGALIGWWVPHLTAVLLAPAIAYLFALITLYTLDPPQWSGIYAVQFLPWMDAAPTITSAAARAAFWVAVSALLAVLLSGAHRAAAVSALVASLSFSVAVLEGPRTSPIEGAMDVRCVGDSPTVCTRELHSAGLANFAGLISEATEHLPQAWSPEHVRTDEAIDLGINNAASVLTIEPIGGTTAPTNLPDRRQTLVAVTETLFRQRCAQSSAETLGLILGHLGTLGIEPHEAVQPWQRPHSDYLPPDELSHALDIADGLMRMSAEKRIEWFEDNEDAINSCTVSTTDLP